MTINKNNQIVLERFDRLEDNVQKWLGDMQVGLEAKLLPLSIAERGLEAFKQDVITQTKAAHDPVLLWQAKIAQDRELTYSHRKIMDRLLDQYDPATDSFRPVQFSKLVKDAHIGKGRTKGYLEVLDKKGLIKTWSDGYRRFVAMRENV